MQNKNTLVTIGSFLGLLLVGYIVFTTVRPLALVSTGNSSSTTVSISAKSTSLVSSTSSQVAIISIASVTSPQARGAYLPYSADRLTAGKNIIFFAASWCPTCRGLDTRINSEVANIPANVTILKADYDKEIDLRKKYSVTYQHTLVQVDAEGKQVNKWNGSENLQQLLENLK